ncbi:MAG: GDSL-type esterase/lipase family protein [Planctomycetota bacterium]
MLKRRLLIARWSLAVLGFSVWLSVTAGEGAPDAPEKLKAWKYADYTQRYFIKVEAPGEAGNIGLHADAMFASVTLPLKRTGEGAVARPEAVALVGEDGVLQPILSRAIPGGSDSEIVFSTYPGLRRFCLYTSASKVPSEVSIQSLRPVPMQVHLRGVSAGADFKAAPGTPLTLKRFQQLEEQGATMLPPPPNGTGIESRIGFQPNIDDPECPYFGIKYSVFDLIKSTADVHNPANYCALYEGFLRCPVSGKYKFAIDTPGAAHLVIDGVSVIAGEMPDEHRDAFALNKTIDLTEGVHRVVVYYAEANPPAEVGAKRTNQDLRRFGIRLHWQPPFASGLMCVPPLAFVKYLPGTVVGSESAPNVAAPFVHLETLGHVRVANQKGDSSAREWVLVSARTVNATAMSRLHINAAGMVECVGQTGQTNVATWVLAGTPVEFKIEGSAGGARVALWPSLKSGLKEQVEREVMDLEAELLVKSTPEFLYPNETGHIHVETVLTPKPVIVHKSRFDVSDVIGWELLPPSPRPMGEFSLYFSQTNPGTATTSSQPATAPLAATPDESERRKIRVSFPVNLNQALAGTSEMTLRLNVGGLECQQENFRLLHAQAPTWPGKLVMNGADIAFQPTGATETQRVVILVPHEDDASHRRLQPLDRLGTVSSASEALFIGDTLVEGIPSAQDNSPTSGLSAALAKAKPGIKWKAIEVAGPHRYRPLLRMLADLDAFVAAQPNRKLPKVAVVNLGTGDVSRQTPLHTFERALDTLIARLNAGGTTHIIVVGAIPEPWRERQCEPYQERVDNVVKQHHVNGINLHHVWTVDPNWTKRFVPDGESGDIIGAVPNAASINDIVQLILSRI